MAQQHNFGHLVPLKVKSEGPAEQEATHSEWRQADNRTTESQADEQT